MKTSVKILYVDDESINLMLFQTMFSKKFDVLIAPSGIQGLDVIEKNPDIKVVISDMKMPGMNGLEFINQARLLNPQSIYYILTGYEISPEIRESINSGLIEEYFQKPFNRGLIDSSICRKLEIV